MCVIPFVLYTKYCILYCVVPMCVLNLKICVLCSALISFKTKKMCVVSWTSDL